MRFGQSKQRPSRAGRFQSLLSRIATCPPAFYGILNPARSLFAVSSWLASELRQARAGPFSFATFLNRCIGARSFTGRVPHFFSIGDENDLITLQRKCIDSIGGCGRPIISLLLVSFFLPSVKVKSSVPGLERIWHI